MKQITALLCSVVLLHGTNAASVGLDTGRTDRNAAQQPLPMGADAHHQATATQGPHHPIPTAPLDQVHQPTVTHPPQHPETPVPHLNNPYHNLPGVPSSAPQNPHHNLPGIPNTEAPQNPYHNLPGAPDSAPQNPYHNLPGTPSLLGNTDGVIMGDPAAHHSAQVGQQSYGYKIDVWTSDVFTAGTDANVQVGLQAKRGRDVGITLDNDHDNFERNRHDQFWVNAPLSYAMVEGICVGVTDSSGGGDAWHANRIEVRFNGNHHGVAHKGFRLKVNSWLEHESSHGYLAVTCCGRVRSGQSECELIYE